MVQATLELMVILSPSSLSVTMTCMCYHGMARMFLSDSLPMMTERKQPSIKASLEAASARKSRNPCSGVSAAAL